MGLENMLVLAKGTGVGGGKDWDFGINRCKLVCIERMKMNRVVPYSIGELYSVSCEKPFVVVESASQVQLFATPWTVTCKAPLSLGFSRQGYWLGLTFLSPGDLPDLGVKPASPVLQADSLPLSHQGSP